jgi:lipopolysaccharide transport protein LptA
VPKRPVASWLAVAGLLAGSHLAVSQNIDYDTSLPITLDADSSEFDRRGEKLQFRGLRITQGKLGIEADLGEVDKLDFNDSEWTFTGNVVIDVDTARIYCESAELVFEDHELRAALLRGGPARFEQRNTADGAMTEGRAGVMAYDLANGVIRLSENAWLSNRANEISSARITYDLNSEKISADSDPDEPVVVVIEQPRAPEPEPDTESAESGENSGTGNGGELPE